MSVQGGAHCACYYPSLLSQLHPSSQRLQPHAEPQFPIQAGSSLLPGCQKLLSVPATPSSLPLLPIPLVYSSLPFFHLTSQPSFSCITPGLLIPLDTQQWVSDSFPQQPLAAQMSGKGEMLGEQPRQHLPSWVSSLWDETGILQSDSHSHTSSTEPYWCTD